MQRSGLRGSVAIHTNEAADELMSNGRVEWAHVIPSPVPPDGLGSLNYNLRDVAARRKGRDLVISGHSEESLGLARGTDIPIAQIDARVRRLPGRLEAISASLRRLRGDGASDFERLFLSGVAEIVRRARCERIMGWDVISWMRPFRSMVPDGVVALAQFHYDYPPTEFDQYDYCDLVAMQTPGQVREAFQRLTHFTPFPLVVPGGVETDLFRPPDSEERRRCRERLGIPPDRFVISFPSKLATYKGTRYLTNWIKWAVTEEPGWFFLVVGWAHRSARHGHGRDLHATLSAGGNVLWLKDVRREEMPEVYHAADVCLMPGLWRESFSTSAMEAMASGLPLVATDHGCYAEIVNDGFDGILCPKEALFRSAIAALRRLASDPALTATMGANARSYVERKLTREKWIANFEAVLSGDYLAVDSDLTVDGP